MPANDELRFTSTESFQLFTEGLRSLQAYGRDARHEALERAATNFEECARKFPADILPKFYLGVVKTELGYTGLDDAIAVFRSILEAKTEQLKPTAEYNLAVAFMRRYMPGDIQTAENILGRLRQELEHLPSSSADDLALRLQVEVLLDFIFVRQNLWFWRFYAEDRQEDVEVARQKLDKFKKDLDVAQISDAKKGDIRAAYLNTEGLLCEYVAHKTLEQTAKRNEAQKAIANFEQALSFKKNWIPALSNLARIYQDILEQQSDATRLWQQVLEIRPDDQYSFYMLGNLYGRENPLRAIRYYGRAPSIPEAGYKLGLAYERTQRREKAIEQYERVSRNWNYPRASFRLGQIFEDEGRLDVALEWYRKADKLPEAQEAIKRIEDTDSPAHQSSD